jgi:O-acetyl-ADP-ribose deacetylase (regulator of RNase III)
MNEKTMGHTRLILEVGDITKMHVDAVVNAANPALMGGGGVDGAIHKLGGHSIQKECRSIIAKIGRLGAGKAVITNAGHLPARYVIHTVGPVWNNGRGNEARVLASAYRESLVLADKMALTSIAFPSISTGAYGYPVLEAAGVALTEIQEYLQAGTTGLERVILTLFSRPDYDIYRQQLEMMESSSGPGSA